MFTQLRLQDFKSFEDTTFALDAFTLLIGSNASGKSNVRDALRILHGVGRGYSVAEILGEKWAEGGVRVWTGVRGGARQAVRYGVEDHAFQITADFTIPSGAGSARPIPMSYRITFRVEENTPEVVGEALMERGKYVFETHPDGVGLGSGAAHRTIKARVRSRGGRPPEQAFLTDRPLLTQMLEPGAATESNRWAAQRAQQFLGAMRFLDLDPDAARRSSQRGITTLGDRGDNLSSVLADLSDSDSARNVLTSWIRALTPMDAVDLRFDDDLNGNTLAVLIEGNGHETPLVSASDGTVRFLAMVAAMLHESTPRVLFFEELENGIHPHRVDLLLDLIETSVRDSGAQVIATSHSPQLLEHGYHAEDARPILIARSADGISVARDVKSESSMTEVIDQDDLSDLMSDGWFEDMAALSAEPESEEGR
ncbi:ATPase [Brachybacterium vulturis]|uniref:ATPase n=1 Tax=Brachybacterium vulturis TaxID=2017484 RepID=A0A291GJ10_9MICO|nr:ATP-binding protein [Brachybacterium vulturis]ATG50513.1 ATPase [Brachybacterium vulturis]